MTDTLFPSDTSGTANGHRPGLARPELTLARVYLRGVGPDAARFDPLDLDHATAGKTASKVLWNLTNTGGKTTLIRLISSVIVTGADVAMGKANIGEYVLTDDTAHVVLEWADAGGARYVTAALYEWPDRTQPANMAISKLGRWWYTFRCEGVGINDLPFTHDGLRLTARSYRTELAELMKDHPAAEFVIEGERQSRWAKILEERTGLDPALIVYQLRMNDTEAGAGDLVKKLNSPDALVRFFMRTLFDESAIADFTATLAAYAQSSKRRAELAAIAEFFGRMVGVLEPLGGAYRLLSDAREADGLARYGADELAARIAARLAVNDAVEASLAEQHEIAAKEAGDLQSQVRSGEDIRAQLQLEVAAFEMADAEAVAVEAAQAERAAKDTLEAWRVLEPIIDWHKAQITAAEAEDAAIKASADIAPYRETLNRATGRLAAKYEALAEVAAATARRADQRLIELKGQKTEANTDRANSADALAETRQQLSAITEAAVASDAALDVLRVAGLIGPRESAADARGRLERRRSELTEQVGGLNERIGKLGETIARLGGDRDRQIQAREALAGPLGGVQADLARHRQMLVRLADDTVIADLTGGQPVEPDQVQGLAEVAAAGARAAEDSLVDLRRRLGEVIHELETFEQTNLAATVDDVEAVAAKLVASGIAARTGWFWLADRVPVPARRRAIAEAWPALAAGVVVTDPARLEEAQAITKPLAESVRTAVRVSAVSRLDGLDSAPEPAGWNQGFVVGPRRALYDPEWARAHAEKLRAERADLAGRCAGLDATAKAGRDAASLADAYLQAWPAETVIGLTESLAGLQSRLGGITERLAGIDTRLGETRSQQTEAERERSAAYDDLRSMEKPLAEVRDAGVKADTAASEALRRPALETVEAAHVREIVQADELLVTLEGQTLEAQRAKSGGEAKAEHYHDQAVNVGVEPSGEEPAQSLEELLSSVVGARAAFNQKVRGVDNEQLQRDATDAAEAAATARSRLSGIAPEVRETAEGLAHTLEGATRSQREEATRRAQEALEEATGVKARAEAKVSGAAGRVKDLSPSGRNVHTVLSGEWRPADAVHARDLFRRIEESLAGLRDRQRERDAQARALAERAAGLRAAAITFNNALDIHPCPDGGVPGVSAWAGSPEQAAQQVKFLRDRRRVTALALTGAEGTQRHLANSVRTTASNSPVRSPLRDRCANETDDDLLGSKASAWAASAEIQRRSCTEELADLVKHRSILVTKLKSLTDTGLRLLREVARASRLPDTKEVGALAGQPAFKVAFTLLSAAEVEARLERRVDEWAEQLDKGKAPGLDERLSWLCAALADTVERSARSGSAWRVEVLKPDVSGTVAYRTPDRIPVEYSGGQELTLAVMMYCTLAAVRAGQRVGNERPAGALLLDNPFGKASNATLIALQQGLAAAAGVQLVCATGINDPVVRAAFEGDDAKLIELRNDRDQRRHLRFLRIADADAAATVRAAVADGRPVNDPRGYLSGLGYRVRDSQ